MQAEPRHNRLRADASSPRREPRRPLRERLGIAALVAAVNLWIGIAQVIADDRSRSFSRLFHTRLAAGGFAADALGRDERVDRILTTKPCATN